MSIESRLRRIERRLGMDDDDELIEFDLGGETVTMMNREFGQLLKQINGTGIRPKTCPTEDSPHDGT
jgi:hypothetical protein